MGFGQAWATKGWVLEASTAGPKGCFKACAAGPMGRALEASTAEPMGCGQAGQAWAPTGFGQVCAGSVHGRAVASEPMVWPGANIVDATKGFILQSRRRRRRELQVRKSS